MSVYIARDKAGDQKSPFWQYDFQRRGCRFSGSFDGQDGKPEITTDRPKKEAERAEAVIRASSGTEQRERPRLTLHEASAYYWTHEGQHHKSADSEWGHIAHLERIIGKNKFVDEIDDAVCAMFVARRRTERARRKTTLVANATVNCDIDVLTQIFKCVRKVSRMPEEVPNWGAHRLPVIKRVRSLSSDEDVSLFGSIDELRPDYRDMCDFALLGGKRLSEIIFLEKAKIDRRARTARVIAKGGREIVMALTDTMMEIVERNWMHHPTRLFTYICQKSGARKMKGGIVVHFRKGKRYPFTKDGWREQWKAILKHADVTDFRFHDFRHTAATRVLAATGNLKAVQDTLDHEDIRSSARYAHTYTDQRREALEAAERLRRSPEKSQKKGAQEK